MGSYKTFNSGENSDIAYQPTVLCMYY